MKFGVSLWCDTRTSRLGNEPNQFSNVDVSQKDWVGLCGKKHVDIDLPTEKQMFTFWDSDMDQDGGRITLTY